MCFSGSRDSGAARLQKRYTYLVLSFGVQVTLVTYLTCDFLIVVHYFKRFRSY